MAQIIIGEHNWKQFAHDQVVSGERKARGLIPRDYDTNPVGSYRGSQSIDIPLIPQSEWSERIKTKVGQKSQLSNLRLDKLGGPAFASLDQGQVGYCWAHSSTHAVMYLRLSANLPTIPLSAYSVAATIKRGADEGGWGAQSLDFIMEKGVMSQNIWPQGDRAYRTYDKAENWANAALHKVTEGWVDIPAAQYDRKLTWDQVITLVLSDVPVVTDFNWWSHSVLGIDAVDGNGLYGVYRIEETGKLATVIEYELIWGINDPMTAGIGLRIQNSWGDSWSQQGTGILTGSKAVPDGAVAPRAVIASAA